MGTNAAAQSHAEAMVEHCFHSHWGIGGEKPYMRYSRLGGYQRNGENVAGSASWAHGTDPCEIRPASQPPDLDNLVRETMTGWLNSSGHRRTLLDPHYRRVNLGIAWRGGVDGYLFRAVQHFESDYTTLDALPVFEGGVIRFAGSTRNGASIDQPAVYVRYDPPPQAATREELNETGSYCGGEPVAAIFPNSRWSGEMSGPVCAGPGEEPFARAAVMIRVPTVAAQVWKVDQTSFEIQADLSEILGQHGPGVYSFAMRGRANGDRRATLMEYAVFYGVGQPLTVAEYVRANNLLGAFVWHPASRIWTMYAERDGRPVPGSTDGPIGEDAIVVPIQS